MIEYLSKEKSLFYDYEYQPMSTEQPLAVQELPLAIRTAEPKPTSSQDLRIHEVSEALLPAYQKASTLELTDDEIAALCEPFPDSIIEIRPHDGLIYIPHIFISNRLNKVFRPGKWALLRRRDWFDSDTSTMYGEYVLLIRGCYVGESVGGHPYVPSNPKTNLSDALESTAAEALRRIAGKRLSCGDQVWQPEYARQWVVNHAEQMHGKWRKKGFHGAPATATPPAPKNRVAAQTRPKEAPPKQATEATKEWMLKALEEMFGSEAVHEYATKNGVLLDTESNADWPMNKVTTSREALGQLQKAMHVFFDGGIPPQSIALTPLREYDEPASAGTRNADDDADDLPFDAGDAPLPKEDEAFKTFVVPYGRFAGKTLGQLETKTLYGFWAGHTVATEWNGKPKRPETIAKDQAFRDALDQAGKVYDFKKKD